MADNDKSLELRGLTLRAMSMARDVMGGLEGKVKKCIIDGDMDYASMLAVKGVLNEAMKTVSEIQELDARIRRLISEGDDDFMEEASNAFLDKTIMITD